MAKQKKLLIIAHCPSPNTQAMAEAIIRGATLIAADSIQPESLKCELKSPFDCHAKDVLEASALILFTTENFGYMNGALKDFFERVFYPCLDDGVRNEGKPYSLIVKAGLDGTGATNSVHKIITGLRWKEINPTLLCKGEFTHNFLGQCQEVGQLMAASLDADII